MSASADSERLSLASSSCDAAPCPPPFPVQRAAGVSDTRGGCVRHKRQVRTPERQSLTSCAPALAEPHVGAPAIGRGSTTQTERISAAQRESGRAQARVHAACLRTAAVRYAESSTQQNVQAQTTTVHMHRQQSSPPREAPAESRRSSATCSASAKDDASWCPVRRPAGRTSESSTGTSPPSSISSTLACAPLSARPSAPKNSKEVIQEWPLSSHRCEHFFITPRLL
jgi:hypothetical protein